MPVLRWESAPAGVAVAFTSRRGGTSSGPFASLNLGALTADEAASVAENRRRAVAAAGGDPALATMAWQEHGRDVREVTAEPACGRFLEPGARAVSASRTASPHRSAAGRWCCSPPTASRSRSHAPTAAGWPSCTPDGAAWRAGSARPASRRSGAEPVAAVGPGAGPCCYEVGEDVAERAAGALRGGCRARRPRRPVAVRPAGARGGGRASGWRSPASAAICNPQRYFSHRRDRGRHRPPGRGGAAACLIPSLIAANLARIRARVGPQVRDPGRDQVRGGGRPAGAARGRGRRWSARTAPTR